MPRLPTPSSANEYIEQQLDKGVEALEARFQAHMIAFNGPLYVGVDTIIRNVVEKRHGEEPGKKRLAFVLNTSGGYIEVVRRVVDTLRRFYDWVDFVVPDYAYSAGTVLAMSGDAIWMDYFSRLGPIDPQVPSRDGSHMLPALGYLERYEGLIGKAKKGTITTAEVQLLIDGFDQAELYEYEQARELSITLLKEWLVKYKFKNWKTTESRGLAVTKQMKTLRARAIAKQLNNTARWHTHGHGISKDVLERDLKLKIDDFGADESLNDIVRGYYSLLDDYMGKCGQTGVVHARGTYLAF